jgi:hypothetical protein
LWRRSGASVQRSSVMKPIAVNDRSQPIDQ